MENQEKKNYLLPLSILLSAILVAVALIYSIGLKNTNPSKQAASLQQATNEQAAAQLTKPQIDDDVILGDPSAPVTVFIFSDYQCPFCGKFFQESESLIRKNYVETNKVKLVYKGLAFLGPESIAAAEAADCAKDQQKYWQYHDALFQAEIKDGQENNGNLNRDLFKQIASDLNMDVNQFLACFDSSKYEAQVQKDNQEAETVMSAPSTPTIFVNDTMIRGAYPYNVFAQAIDQALQGK